MKKIALLLTLLMCIFANSQTKITVAILPTLYDPNTSSASAAYTAYETIVNAFFSTKRFTILERERINELQKEKNLQRTEAFMDNNTTIKEGIALGASYVITSRLSSNNLIQMLQIKIVNVSTGEVLATEMITTKPVEYDASALSTLNKKSKTYNLSNLDKVVGNTELEILKNNIITFININFPITLTDIEPVNQYEYEIKSNIPRYGDIFLLYFVNLDDNKRILLGRGVIFDSYGKSTFGTVYQSDKKNMKEIASIFKVKKSNKKKQEEEEPTQLPNYRYELEITND